MYDFAIIGGGIVGLSTGWALGKNRPDARILVLEKEKAWAKHQTGHNSGVIHSGVYYRPGSLKARFAREGGAALVRFCEENGIEYEICGKVMVATETRELPLLKNLHERGLKNGLNVEIVGPERLREIEPHASGIAAIRVPSAGIVDYRTVSATFAELSERQGATMMLGAEVTDIAETGRGVEIRTSKGDFSAGVLVNCAGLHSDRVAALCGVDARVKIVPFRGEYYELVPQRRHLVKSLIYPVPNPDFPFLGVHFTRMIEGGVEAGPNAVLGLAREGYRKSDIDLRDLSETLTYPALWRLARAYWRTGAGEIFRSMSKRAFVRGLRRLVPEIEEGDLIPAPAGVRAQALSHDGKLLDDFLIVEGKGSIHVLNAPSPAATAAIPIGEAIAERAAERARKNSG